RVAIGQIDVAEVILDCPWEADSMAVADLLTSQRRWGQTRCRKFLAQVPMSEKKTVGSMTDRQRRSLALMLSPAQRDRAGGAAPWAYGKPDESLPCHHPASIPISPRRGRPSHTPHPPWPRSLTARRANL